MEIFQRDNLWAITHAGKVVAKRFTSEDAAYAWADKHIDDQVFDEPNSFSSPLEYEEGSSSASCPQGSAAMTPNTPDAPVEGVGSALVALAAWCEDATGLDRELDCHIYMAVNGIPDVCGGRLVLEDGHPAYTASLDAAMTLVPEDADSGGERLKVDAWNGNGVHAAHVRATAWVAGARRVYAATPALALCAAALRARAASQDDRNGQ